MSWVEWGCAAVPRERVIYMTEGMGASIGLRPATWAAKDGPETLTLSGLRHERTLQKSGQAPGA